MFLYLFFIELYLKLGCDIVEDLCKKQAEIIKLLTDAILINSKQEYIKSIKHICIAIITSFTILICFFSYMYFTNDYSEEIRAKNTTEHTENYNYTEYKENIRKEVDNNVGMD